MFSCILRQPLVRGGESLLDREGGGRYTCHMSVLKIICGKEVEVLPSLLCQG